MIIKFNEFILKTGIHHLNVDPYTGPRDGLSHDKRMLKKKGCNLNALLTGLGPDFKEF
jgi:hypothetical protein